LKRAPRKTLGRYDRDGRQRAPENGRGAPPRSSRTDSECLIIPHYQTVDNTRRCDAPRAAPAHYVR